MLWHLSSTVLNAQSYRSRRKDQLVCECAAWIMPITVWQEAGTHLQAGIPTKVQA